MKVLIKFACIDLSEAQDVLNMELQEIRGCFLYIVALFKAFLYRFENIYFRLCKSLSYFLEEIVEFFEILK